MYVSVFDKKKEFSNKYIFSKRVNTLMLQVSKVFFGLIDNEFINSDYGNGFTSINDYLNTIEGFEAFDVFRNSNGVNNFIKDEIFFMNIELYATIIYLTSLHSRYPKAVKNIIKAFSDFVVWRGFKLVEENNIFRIVNADLPVQIEDIKNDDMKNDFLQYYSYLSYKDLHEKKKLLFAVAHELESRKVDIIRVFGKDVKKSIGYFANQFHIRHPNHETIEGLSSAEIESWYDYIYSFFISTLTSLDNLAEVNTN